MTAPRICDGCGRALAGADDGFFFDEPAYRVQLVSHACDTNDRRYLSPLPHLPGGGPPNDDPPPPTPEGARALAPTAEAPSPASMPND